MATMKRLGLEVLEDIHHNGPDTRKTLWDRNPVCSWHMFKLLIGKLTADGVIERRLYSHLRNQRAYPNALLDTYVLTEEGKSIVQNVCE